MSLLESIRLNLFGVTSSTKNAIISTSKTNDFVVQKKAYSIRQSIPVLTAATTRILFDTTGMENDTLVSPFKVSTNVGPCHMSFTSDLTYTSADTPLLVLNRYGVVAVTDSGVKNYTNITGLVIGSEPATYPLGSKSTNQASGGGVVAGQAIFFFEKDKQYLISITNNSGEAVDVGFQFDWYED